MRLPYHVRLVSQNSGLHAKLVVVPDIEAELFWHLGPVVLLERTRETTRANDCADLEVAMRVLATAWGFESVEDMLGDLWQKGKANRRNIMLLNEDLQKEVPGMK